MSEAPPPLVGWRQVQTTLRWALLLVTAASSASAYFFWGAVPALVTVLAALCLALGFWLTERLIGVFTRTYSANPTALLLIFTGKLGWWALLFFAARHLPAGMDKPIGLGIGSFLLAVFIAMLRHYGMPRISDGNPPNSP